MRLLAGSFVEIDAVKMSLDIFKMVLVPILAAFVHDFMSSKDRRVRIATLTCFGLGLAWLLWLSFGNGWPWFPNAIDYLQFHGTWITLAAAGIWCVLWWSFAARRYLRLPHAAAIGALMTALAMLLVTLALLIYPGGTWLTWDL